MIKKTLLGIVAAAGMATLGTLAIDTAHAANPASFFHWAPASQPYTASTANRWVTFVARIPRSVFAQRDSQIDVTGASFGTTFNMEQLVLCSNGSGVSGSKSGDYPITSADDYTLTCPFGTTVSGTQGGLLITN